MHSVIIIYLMGVVSGLILIYRREKRPKLFSTRTKNIHMEMFIKEVPHPYAINSRGGENQKNKCNKTKKIRMYIKILLFFAFVEIFLIYYKTNSDEYLLNKIKELKESIHPVFEWVLKIAGSIAAYVSGLCTPYLTNVATKELKKARKRRKKKKKSKRKKKKKKN